MRRGLPAILAALSLLLSLVLLVAWPLSFWRAVTMHPLLDGQVVDVWRGLILIQRPSGQVYRWQFFYPEKLDLVVETGGWSVAGFGASGRAFPVPTRWCPIWFPAVALLIPPAWWLGRRKGGATGFPVEGTEVAR